MLRPLQNFLTRRRLFFLLLFSLFAFITQRINFSGIIGADNQYFTLFQFFGPIAGSFLGPVTGVIAVLFAEMADFLMVGKEWTFLNLARLVPMLLATYYFATNKRVLTLIMPIIAIAAFVLHPVGRTVWFFTLFWTAPIIVWLLPKKYGESVLAKSFGATFTAHAIGGALWIWTYPMSAEQWIGLIPIVTYERTLFALGITFSYLAMNFVLDWVLNAVKLSGSPEIAINKKYTFSNLLKVVKS